MTKIKTLTSAGLIAAVLFAPLGAQAHCDSIDGPVAKAAQAALDAGNVHLALPYAPASAEGEIRAAFAQALKVRALGPDAKALADKAFIETTVRLHRMGEGAPYTGLKPSGIDYGPAIPAAERAVEEGNLSEVKAVLAEEIEHGLHGRFTRVGETQQAPRAPKTAEEVAAARARVSAELGFVTYVEGVRQAIHGASHAHKD